MPEMPLETEFRRAVEIMARLRSPDGCPWDRAQDFDSIRPYTLEETYEVLEAIDRCDWKGLEEELGDLLLQVLFYSQMAGEQGWFDIRDVVHGLAEKLIYRHPHVFAGAEGRLQDAESALARWEDRKGPAKETGLLGGVGRGLPALLEARKIGARAGRAGFDWPHAEGILRKLEEEIAELRHAMAQAPQAPAAGGNGSAGVEEEIGDILFTAVNLARKLEVDPELALKQCNRKFRARVAHMEASLAAQGKAWESASAAELETLWQASKQPR